MSKRDHREKKMTESFQCVELRVKSYRSLPKTTQKRARKTMNVAAIIYAIMHVKIFIQ
jgi:DMSO/TMAO reductase YedYZ heme-binding membrane subunit